MYGVYHGATYYISFRSTLRDAYVQNVAPTVTDADLDKAINKILFDDTSALATDNTLSSIDQSVNKFLFNDAGSTGFIGFMRETAHQGISISRAASSSSGSEVELQDTGVLIYWLVEILLAGGIAAALPFRAASQPFDEDANSWYGKPTLLAMTSIKSRKALLNAFRDGDFQQAGGLLTTDNLRYPRMEVLISRSPDANNPTQDIFLTVNNTQRKGRTTVQRKGIISPSELELDQFLDETGGITRSAKRRTRRFQALNSTTAL